jgi:hypothetical protein
MEAEVAGLHDWRDKFSDLVENSPATSLSVLMEFESKAISIKQISISTRLNNLLLRHGLTDLALMCQLSYREVADLRGMGRKTLEEYLRIIEEHARPDSITASAEFNEIEQVWDWCVAHFPTGFKMERENEEFPILEVALKSKVEEEPKILSRIQLTEVGRLQEFKSLFSEHLGSEFESHTNANENHIYRLVLILKNGEELELASVPPRVSSGRTLSEDTDFWIVNEEDISQSNFSYLTPLEDFLETLTSAEVAVLSDRLGYGERKTLDEIGKNFGLSRERIRQIENKLLKKIMDVINNYGPQYLSIEPRVTRYELLEGRVNSLTLKTAKGSILDLFVASGRIARIEFEKVLTEWLVIDEFKFIDKISQFGTIKELLKWVDEANPSIQIFNDLMSQIGLQGNLLVSFMADFNLESGQNCVRSAPKRLADKIKAAMQDRDQPMTGEEIEAAIGSAWSVRSAINLMSADSLFMSVDISTYALSEWGLREYRGIREEILEIVADQGPTHIHEVVDQVTEWFPKVSKNSVKTYASAYPLQITEGIVSIVESTDIKRFSFEEMKPRQLKNLFSLNEEHRLRIEINLDHLRGSGFPCSRAVSALIGLKVGESWTSPISESKCNFNFYNRGNQAAVGSIQAALIEQNAALDDFGFLVLVGAIGKIEKVEFKLLRSSELSSDPVLLALQLVGQDTATIDPLSKVLASLGVNSKGTWSDVENIATSRGDVLLARAARLVQIQESD